MPSSPTRTQPGNASRTYNLQSPDRPVIMVDPHSLTDVPNPNSEELDEEESYTNSTLSNSQQLPGVLNLWSSSQILRRRGNGYGRRNDQKKKSKSGESCRILNVLTLFSLNPHHGHWRYSQGLQSSARVSSWGLWEDICCKIF